MAESQDATLLQRRARRRLVGAVALVIFVVIVLPIVLEDERKPVGQDLVIQIPSQDGGKFNSRVLPPKAPTAGSDVQQGAAKADAPAAAADGKPAKALGKPEQSSGKPQAVDSRESATRGQSPPAGKAQAAAESGDKRAKAGSSPSNTWVVQIGAFADPKNAKQLQAKLTAAGIKSYSETVKAKNGEQTRVRLGPFAGRADAEKAGEKAKALGFRADLVAPGAPGR
ncbi:MAG: SPOR domain-containing protein [Betaproteobacteria bacterium]|nr:SPOR domain-containing protein [Betaproteobacteria bacterium]